MPRLSNRRTRHSKQRPDMVRLLDHRSCLPPVTKRRKNTIHSQQPQEHVENTHPLPSGADRITLRVTRRPYEGSGHEQRVWWTAPRILLEPQGNEGQGGLIVKEKSREDWLRRLRPRPTRGPESKKGKSSRRKDRLARDAGFN